LLPRFAVMTAITRNRLKSKAILKKFGVDEGVAMGLV
jgi:hypothetical protein